MATKIEIMDGNPSAAYISYAFTEVAGIFPITPSSPMAVYVDEWLPMERKTSLVSQYRWLKCSLKAVPPAQFMALSSLEL